MEVENYKKGIFSEDWETVKTSANNLAKIGGDDVVDFLIGLLDLENSGIRNRAALALSDLKDNRAIEPLLKSIFKAENKNYNGTMVYALQSLDCKDKLVDIFKILFYQEYEPKIGAYTILEEQEFEFTTDDLMKIQRMWKECCQIPKKGKGFDKEETKLMMQDAYEGFMEYLKKEK